MDAYKRKCLSPEDLDTRGHRCGKRAKRGLASQSKPTKPKKSTKPKANKRVGDRLKLGPETTHTDVINTVKANYKKELAALDRALKPTKTFQKIESERKMLVAKAINKTASTQDYVRLNFLDAGHPKRFQREEKRKLKAMQKISAKLRSRGRINDQQASNMASLIDIDSSVGGFISEVELRAQMADFFQMTGGKGSSTIIRMTKDNDRASTNRLGKINIGGDKSKNAIWHEAGHHIEFGNPEIARLSQEWRDSKATGPITTLNDITNSDRYNKMELAVPDEYISPYVGKVYATRTTPFVEDPSTEVVSMGVEHFRLAENMIMLYEGDKEHFLYTLGILDSDV